MEAILPLILSSPLQLLGTGFCSSCLASPRARDSAPMFWNKWKLPKQVSRSHSSSPEVTTCLAQSIIPLLQNVNHRRSPAWEKQLTRNNRITVCHIYKSLQLIFISPNNLCLRSVKLFKYPVFSLNRLTCGSWQCLGHFFFAVKARAISRNTPSEELVPCRGSSYLSSLVPPKCRHTSSFQWKGNTRFKSFLFYHTLCMAYTSFLSRATWSILSTQNVYLTPRR